MATHVVHYLSLSSSFRSSLLSHLFFLFSLSLSLYKVWSFVYIQSWRRIKLELVDGLTIGAVTRPREQHPRVGIAIGLQL